MMHEWWLIVNIRQRFLVITVLHLPYNITFATKMDHITPIQRSLEDTAKYGGLFMIFREFPQHGYTSGGPGMKTLTAQ